MTLMLFKKHLELQDNLPKFASKYNFTKQYIEMTLLMFKEHLELQDTLPKPALNYNCTKQLKEMTLIIFKKHLECHFAKACFEILFYNTTFNDPYYITRGIYYYKPI